MKRSHLFLLLASLFIGLSSCGGTSSMESSSSETTSEYQIPGYYQELKLAMQTSKASTSKINPFIYGTFIEHIDTCIYGGIWAEIIMDRKFYKPVGQDVSQWAISSGGPVMETNDPFEGEYSLSMKKGDKVRQNGIALDLDKDYDGYFYAKGSGTVDISVYLSSSNTIKDTISIDSNEYKKYTYSLHSVEKTLKGKLYIECSNGDVTLDSISLMPSDNYYGMRKDTLDVLKELNSPFYRWPGGNFVSGYDFYDGIGDRDLRPTKRNLNYCGLESDFEDDDARLANDLIKIGSLGFYGAFEPNDFGLDEFIMMCRYLNAEPNIVVNSGLGDSQMARDEVEYCNGTSGYGLKRGISKEPYNVKYFSIGNEMNGSWQLGHTTINEYTKRHNEFAKAMLEVDPTIKLIAVGDNWSDWTYKMVQSCADYMDYSSEHFYATRYENDLRDHVLSLKNQATNRIQRHRNIPGIGNIKMAIDEYAYENAECASRLKDGMGVASCLNEMHKNADVVEIACYSSTVNATQGNMITDKLNAFMEGSGYVLSLYHDNMLDYYCPVTYKTCNSNEYYEMSATVNASKTEATISVINGTTDYLKINCSNIQEIISVDYIQGDYLESFNDSSRNELKRYQKNLPTTYLVAEPYSISLFKVKI